MRVYARVPYDGDLQFILNAIVHKKKEQMQRWQQRYSRCSRGRVGRDGIAHAAEAELVAATEMAADAAKAA